MKRAMTFPENLKFYRTKQGLTQKQLADLIGYTEKSVSKWEKGNGLPTMELVIKLADLFKISLDELLLERIQSNYFLGIDGGGTKTAFKLTDENGVVISEVFKGPSNPNDIGMESATALLRDGINEVCKGIPLSKVTMFAGLSGGGMTGDNAKILNGFFEKFGFYAFQNGSDIENLVELSQCEECVLVIMGTGFLVYAITPEKRKRISGWGQFFDEGGSGYTVGRDGIAAALSEGDGSGNKTLITPLLEAKIGETAEEHIARFYNGGKRYIASFADVVFKAAEKGDRIAESILEKNMRFAAEKIDAAAKDLKVDGKIPVIFSGGIVAKADLIFDMIRKNMSVKNVEFIKPQLEAVDGAVRRARRIYEAKISEGIK